MNAIDKVVSSLDWITITLFLSMVMIALGKYLFQARFSNFIILPFNDKYVLLHNKKGQLFNWFHILLTLFQLINLALYLFFLQRNLLSSQLGDDQTAFFYILGFLILFQLAKLVLQSAKGFVFNTQELISELMFSKISYLNYSSLVMFIANVILAYVLKDSKIIIYGSILLIVAINGIGVFKVLKNYQKALFPYFVYFILYLCALEIAPLVIIGSYLKN